MKQLIIGILLALFVSGCGFVERTWEEHREDILNEVVEALEEEKEKDRLLDELIDQLEERRAAIAPVNS